MIWFSVALMMFGAAGAAAALFGTEYNTGLHGPWVPWVGLSGIAAFLAGFGTCVYVLAGYLVSLL